MSNDHYVPQHFLRGWSFDQSEKKLYAYKIIDYTGEVKFDSNRSIISTSSSKDLYQISDGKDSASFETSVMTDSVDTPFSPIIAKFRTGGLISLAPEEKAKLAQYIVILEARNPAVLKQMTLNSEDLKDIFAKASLTGASQDSINYVHGRLESMLRSSGAAAAGMYAGWGNGPDAQSLLKKTWHEIQLDSTYRFITSNYPVGRHGRYEDPNAFVALAMSPTKALIFGGSKYIESLANLSPKTKCHIVNLMTLGRAQEAYSDIADRSEFIEQHLGWMLRVEDSRRGTYMADALSKAGVSDT